MLQFCEETFFMVINANLVMLYALSRKQIILINKH